MSASSKHAAQWTFGRTVLSSSCRRSIVGQLRTPFCFYDYVKSWEETNMYTDPPIRGYIILSVIGILLILIVPTIGMSIYGS